MGQALHRDIKHGNVFLTPDLQCKLGDFGLTRKIGTPEFSGSVQYMAPEIIRKQPCTEKSDVWSLGCLLFELQYHCFPYEVSDGRLSNIKKENIKRTTSSNEVYPLILKYNPNIFQPDGSLVANEPEDKETLEHLLFYMLQPNPEKRFDMKQVLAHLWLIKHSADFQKLKLQ